MITKEQLETILSRESSEKIDLLIDYPDTYCSEMVSVCEYWIVNSEIKESMRNHMILLKSHIETDPDIYVLEELVIHDFEE